MLGGKGKDCLMSLAEEGEDAPRLELFLFASRKKILARAWAWMARAERLSRPRRKASHV